MLRIGEVLATGDRQTATVDLLAGRKKNLYQCVKRLASLRVDRDTTDFQAGTGLWRKDEYDPGCC